MPKVIADITMSLDGYVTGPLADSQHGLGDVDELHTWVADQDPVDIEILERIAATTGAVVMGRRLFDIVDGPNGWTRDMGYGAQQAATPFFVVTHSAPQHVRLERELGMRFPFETASSSTRPGGCGTAATHSPRPWARCRSRPTRRPKSCPTQLWPWCR